MNLPLEEVEKLVGSKYSAVVAIAKCALEANRRFLTMRASRHNPVAWAIKEILEGKVVLKPPTPGETPPAGLRAAVSQPLRAVRFVHEEDVQLEAEELGLDRELAGEKAEEEEKEVVEEEGEGAEEEKEGEEESEEEPSEEGEEKEVSLEQLNEEEEKES